MIFDKTKLEKKAGKNKLKKGKGGKGGKNKGIQMERSNKESKEGRNEQTLRSQIWR